MKHFKGFSKGFTKLHAKLDEDTLLEFAIHHRQNETKSKKHSCKKKACSQHDVTWQTDAIHLWKCDLGLPSRLLSLRQLQQQQSGNFLNSIIFFVPSIWHKLLRDDVLKFQLILNPNLFETRNNVRLDEMVVVSWACLMHLNTSF
jgi:hypothetical protein